LGWVFPSMAVTSPSFWQVFDNVAAGLSKLSPAAQPGGGGLSYFTYPTNTVMGLGSGGKKTINPSRYTGPARKPTQCEVTGEPSFLRAVSVGCRCRFCSRCCYPAGRKIRDRLLPIVEGFTDVYMLTLTIDPKLFPSPGEALDYLQAKRCIARLVRSLRRISAGRVTDAAGRRLAELHSDRFFCSLEFQANTSPHFHLLLDASRVDFDTLCVEWGRFRPVKSAQLPIQDFTSAALKLESSRRRKTGKSGILNWREKLLIERDCFRDMRLASKSGGPSLAPAFGHVRFSSDAKYINGSAGRKKAQRAARYVTKYIFKEPEGGWPSWVLDRERLRRFSTSHKFWTSSAEPSLADAVQQPSRQRPQPPPGVATDCSICRHCGEYRDGTCVCYRPRIRDRLKTCGTSTNIVEIKPVYDPATLRVFERVRHLYRVSLPLDVVLDDIAADNRKPGMLRWDIPAYSVPPLIQKLSGRSGLDEQQLAQLEAWKAEPVQPNRLELLQQQEIDELSWSLSRLQYNTT